MRQPYKTGLLWLIIIVTFLIIYRVFPGNGQKGEELTRGQFRDRVESAQITTLEVDGDEIRGTLKGDKKFVVYGPIPDDLHEKLEQQARKDADFVFKYKPEEKDTFLQSLVISWLPMLVLFVIFFIFMRQLQSGGGKAMSFGKSKAKLLSESNKKVTFDDIAGVEEAKEELQEII
ncbi:MAG: ATP-dependent metallopeptidase FtsH/Yme1/Tma family protein, partial [Myxococcales bacterium]|nr:ATP-dependent metallopeptidase FtsH/Yme1/Tma family protein [Myxococcales bacterium]